ncbi:MAG: ribonuclease M5 [Mycoplasmatales bacterium]
MNTIIIVEGKSDTNRLNAIYNDIITFETSGLGLDQEKINYLKSIEVDSKLIVFTDPDGPGEIIRARLSKELKNLYHAYLPNEKALSKNKKKVGIEHATEKDIKEALANLYQHKKAKNTLYTMEDLINIGIYTNKKARIEFCDYFHIAFGNNKKILKQLNYFDIEPEKIKNYLEDKNGTS